MQLKTSSLIARKFTGYVSGLLLLLAILLNSLFFLAWYRAEDIKLHGWPIPKPIIRAIHKNNKNNDKKNRLPFIALDQVRKLPFDTATLEQLQENILFKNISNIDDNYIMYIVDTSNNEIKFSHIHEQLNAQIRLLWMSLIFVILFALLTYWLSHIFVKSSFYRVNKLLTYVQWLNIHNLDTKVPQLWPEDDEIQIIADKLQESLDTIKLQTDNLKHFISYASHELKTPLMSISALIDVGEKTGKYDLIKDKIKSSVLTMNNLIEQLLVQLKEEKEIKENEDNESDISEIIWEIMNEVKLLYPSHLLNTKLTKSKYIAHIPKQHLITIVQNILQNACKYSAEGSIVQIIIDSTTIKIKDQWIGIAKKDRDHIRNEFYRVDQWKKGHGLWLSIVKKIIDQYNWRIEVISKEGIWSEFIIYYL